MHSHLPNVLFLWDIFADRRTFLTGVRSRRSKSGRRSVGRSARTARSARSRSAGTRSWRWRRTTLKRPWQWAAAWAAACLCTTCQCPNSNSTAAASSNSTSSPRNPIKAATRMRATVVGTAAGARRAGRIRAMELSIRMAGTMTLLKILRSGVRWTGLSIIGVTSIGGRSIRGGGRVFRRWRMRLRTWILLGIRGGDGAEASCWHWDGCCLVGFFCFLPAASATPRLVYDSRMREMRYDYDGEIHIQ